MRLIVAADKLLYNGELVDDHVLEIKHGKIVNLLSKETVRKPDYTYRGIIAPGLIDTHIHGYEGVEVIDASVEELVTMKQKLLKCGVTSFLPTLQTDAPDKISQAINNITEAQKNSQGAQIVGIFLEGPFLAEAFKGAQDGRFLQEPSIEQLREWQAESDGLIKKIAIAPELAGASEFITYATQQGIVVAIGHSNATAAEAENAIDNGATVAIHTFNAMRYLHHREPGIIGESLINDDLYAELICDGYHLDKRIVDLILRAKGVDRSLLITDGTKASGLPDGDYNRSGVPIQVRGGAVRTKDGALAGSSLSLLQAVKNIVTWDKVSLVEALQMATINPAKSLKLEKEFGGFCKGARADFVVLDVQLDVIATWVNGVENLINKENE
ncbi:N-acetylglucosamine-6-phosphate deacetylase [Amphibacillus marinus]|nr:N-acetylglucosamine-6-phosphate deacetylase [Amphibacillus marinus]